MTRSDRRLLAVAAALATAALAVGIGRTDLWPPDETRVAEISREMRAERSWLVPQLNGTPFLEEPPLFYWFQAGAYRLAGGAPPPPAGGAPTPGAGGGGAGGGGAPPGGGVPAAGRAPLPPPPP